MMSLINYLVVVLFFYLINKLIIYKYTVSIVDLVQSQLAHN